MIKLIVKYKFQKHVRMYGYEYPQKVSIVTFYNYKDITDENIIKKLEKLEEEYSNGYELIDVKVINNINDET